MDAEQPATKVKRKFYQRMWPKIVIVLLIGGFFTVKNLRERARQVETIDNFQAIRYGLGSWDYCHGVLPRTIRRASPSDGTKSWLVDPPDQTTDGEPLGSWRTAMGCFIFMWSVDPEAPCPQPRFEEPWDSSHNMEIDKHHDGWPFTCRWTDSLDTKALAITGPDTAFDEDADRRSLKDLPNDIILVVECADSGIHYRQPGDFDIRTMPRTINDPSGKGISSRNRHGFCVLFADCEVWVLGHDTPFEELEKFFTITSVNQYDREAVLGPYRRRF